MSAKMKAHVVSREIKEIPCTDFRILVISADEGKPKYE
jgi:hypothetical protein